MQCFVRNLFGRLLFLPQLQSFYLKRVLAYPLTPVPLILANIDGLKISTDISTLSSKLEVRIITDAPRYIDVCFALMECSWYGLM